MGMILSILVFCLILGLVYWAIEQIPLPSPFNWVVRVILVIVAIYFLLQYAPLR